MKTAKKLFLLCLLGMMGMKASGIGHDYDFEAYGLYYRINSTGDLTCVGPVIDSSFNGSISIPDFISYDGKTYHVTCIGDNSFSNLERLTHVHISDGITSIGSYAFSFSPNLNNIRLPEELNSIGECAFCGCKSLTSIVIPNGVTTLGYQTFASCDNLTSITLPEGLVSIESYVFNQCYNLTHIIFPQSMTQIGVGAFCGCSKLSSISLPEKMICIEDFTFSGCMNLNSVYIPNSVTTIGTKAFRSCSNLTNITIPNYVTSIREESFCGCSKLTDVIIPNSVTTIGASAFDDCYNLTNVTIGRSVKTIGVGAFDCRNLTNVTFLGTSPPWLESTQYVNPFSDTWRITFHVPIGYKETYLAAQDYWRGYTIVEDVFNYKYINSNENSFESLLNYDDAKNNTIVIEDGNKFIEVKENILLKQISYERNFTNTKWQSFYVPFEIPVTEELLEEFEFAYINGAKLYDWDDDGTAEDTAIEIFKVKKGTLRANHPYLIRAKETGSKTITVNEATLYATEEKSVDCSTTDLLFTFKGGYSKLGYNDIGGCYVLGGGTWNPVKEGGSMKPMRFYLKIESRGDGQVIPASAAANPIRMTVAGEEGETTEIEASPMSSPEGKELIFDLQGRPVEHPEKGIYIINGKKVLVK